MRHLGFWSFLPLFHSFISRFKSCWTVLIVRQTSSVKLRFFGHKKRPGNGFAVTQSDDLLWNCSKRGENAPENAKMMVYKKRLIDHHTCLPQLDSNQRPAHFAPRFGYKHHTVLFVLRVAPFVRFSPNNVCLAAMLRRLVGSFSYRTKKRDT